MSETSDNSTLGRPSNLFKPFANRLAQLAMNQTVGEATSMLVASGLWPSLSTKAGSQSEERLSMAAPANNSDWVGIWNRQQKNGKTCFVRSMDKLREWHLWANIGTIEQKGIKPRIVLIGESVARGYLYDPQFTPAAALTMILETYLGKDRMEVLDLARTDLSFEFRDLAHSVTLLQPDIVIIFSGNNWRIPVTDPRLRPHLTEMLHQSGIGSVKQLVAQHLEEKVRQLVKDVSASYKIKAIPLIWIIPEFNLGDWRDPISNAPRLGKDRTREWLDQFDLAEDALRNGDLSSASEHAERMIELDQGGTSSGYQILAECSRRRGEPDKTRSYLESARDADILCTGLINSPRTHSVFQDILREEAAKRGHAVVDTPRLFREYLNGEIPDRRLFLDYCHLSARGIRVTMAAAASCVLKILKGVSVSWRALASETVAPSPKVQGAASFLAAIHNAHWWQPYDRVYSHCLQALEFDPGVAELMLTFIDMQTRLAPLLMCSSAERLHQLASPLVDRYVFHSNLQQLDRLLLDAMVNALQKMGISTRDRLNELRRCEHSVTHRETNLLKYTYCSSAKTGDVMGVARQRVAEARPPSDAGYYRAFWRESGFVFVGEAHHSVQLRLTCRLPQTSLSDGVISIEINGKDGFQLPVSRQWITWNISIPGERVQDDLNDIVIHWPLPELPEAQTFATSDDALFGAAPTGNFCAFGEIHSFIASSTKDCS